MDVYEQRIIGYADILGWRASCYDLSQFTRLQTAAESIAGYGLVFPLSAKESAAAGIEFSFFSVTLRFPRQSIVRRCFSAFSLWRPKNYLGRSSWFEVQSRWVASTTSAALFLDQHSSKLSLWNRMMHAIQGCFAAKVCVNFWIRLITRSKSSCVTSINTGL